MDPLTGHAPTGVRVATPSDIDAIVEIFTSAFFDDPLWGPVFPDRTRRVQQATAFWRLFTTSAIRYPWTFLTEHGESAAMWIPADGIDLTSAEEESFENFLIEIGDHPIAKNILAIMDQFAKARPTEPHFYLSLLGTLQSFRGQGLGMALLRENLGRIDAQGAPAYLESTNALNNARYESVGFRPHGSFTIPSGLVVTTMWRPTKY
ncbi:MAG: GNAT family N-acetyltransferase [Actinomycetes bacterium]